MYIVHIREDTFMADTNIVMNATESQTQVTYALTNIYNTHNPWSEQTHITV